MKRSSHKDQKIQKLSKICTICNFYSNFYANHRKISELWKEVLTKFRILCGTDVVYRSTPSTAFFCGAWSQASTLPAIWAACRHTRLNGCWKVSACVNGDRRVLRAQTREHICLTCIIALNTKVLGFQNVMYFIQGCNNLMYFEQLSCLRHICLIFKVALNTRIFGNVDAFGG